MEDDKDVPSSNPTPDNAPNKKEMSAEDQMANADERFDQSSFNLDSIPHYEDLRAIQPPGATSKDIVAFYSEHLEHVLGFSWEVNEEARKTAPTLPAPTLSGSQHGEVSTEQLARGVCLAIPRCSKIWADDQLKVRWGRSMFYTAVPRCEDRKGPRVIMFVAAEGVPNDRTGLIDIHYEVVRRKRLIGVSETLTINVRDDGKNAPGSSYGRPTRRGRLDV